MEGCPLRIMPFGDSITQGGPGRSAYRRPLWWLLRRAGVCFRFVGTRNASGRNTPTAEADFDLWHEGWSGKRTFHLLRLSAVPMAASQCQPDVVLFHLGVNDLLTAERPERIADNVGRLLRQFHAGNPSVTILLSKLLPIKGQDPHRRKGLFRLFQQVAEQGNRQMQKRLTCPAPSGRDCHRAAAAARWLRVPEVVRVCDIGLDFSTTRHLGDDGIHPNEDGYRLVARNWFREGSGRPATVQPTYAWPKAPPPASVATVVLDSRPLPPEASPAVAPCGRPCASPWPALTAGRW
eukprot:EG_transcript_20093